jgi:hypothetical protein
VSYSQQSDNGIGISIVSSSLVCGDAASSPTAVTQVLALGLVLTASIATPSKGKQFRNHDKRLIKAIQARRKPSENIQRTVVQFSGVKSAIMFANKCWKYKHCVASQSDPIIRANIAEPVNKGLCRSSPLVNRGFRSKISQDSVARDFFSSPRH